MAGTRKGGLKAAATNRARHGQDFYIKVGKLGGQASLGGGFARNPSLAVIAGRIGGSRSKSTKTYCIRGHELVDPNLYYYQGKRQCKLCMKFHRAKMAEKLKHRRIYSKSKDFGFDR